ncbi:hypothetical protein [Desulfonatronovibrio hydrogenovorans]|uniref:iron-sulfur cluster-binding protein n=1 Tax=Desulfonatronovibrio hydrogenovorans TaxID=53245 RepID=UPI000689F306|nr:hypothetical protein [Desulfonatronovibrio hydrogenovorans]
MKQLNNHESRTCVRTMVRMVTPAGSDGFISLYLDLPEWDYTPGQFVMIRPENWDNDPVWPRPFSICEVNRNGLRLFIQVVGRGTRLISRLTPGSRVDLWGPLGNGFKFDPDDRLLILAGGMGIAPFIGLCKNHPHPEKVSLLFGHRVGIECYPLDELPQGMDKQYARQEGQSDLVLFQEMLEKRIQEFSGLGRILACGPTPLLRVVSSLSLKYKAETYVSLENKMACGVGACLGCVARTSDQGYVQTCTHGPVFRADRIVWEV